MKSDWKCMDCGVVENHDILPEEPACACGGYMREVPGTCFGEKTTGMRRLARENDRDEFGGIID